MWEWAWFSEAGRTYIHNQEASSGDQKEPTILSVADVIWTFLILQASEIRDIGITLPESSINITTAFILQIQGRTRQRGIANSVEFDVKISLSKSTLNLNCFFMGSQRSDMHWCGRIPPTSCQYIYMYMYMYMYVYVNKYVRCRMSSTTAFPTCTLDVLTCRYMT